LIKVRRLAFAIVEGQPNFLDCGCICPETCEYTTAPTLSRLAVSCFAIALENIGFEIQV
jgi:hypothetical protein